MVYAIFFIYGLVNGLRKSQLSLPRYKPLGVLEYWSYGVLEKTGSVSFYHYSNTPELHYSCDSLTQDEAEVRIPIETNLFEPGSSLIEYRQFFLRGKFTAANLIFTCQFELKTVCQCLPAGFDNVF